MAADLLTLRIEVQDDGSAVIRDFQGNVQNLGRSTEQSSGALTRMGEGAKNVGAALSGVAAGGLAAMAAGVYKGVQAYAEFEDQMVSVRKTTGMSVEEIAGLGDSLREMASAGGSLAGVTAMELGQIAEVAGQLGINGKQNILDFSHTIAEMTIATGMSAEATASGMAAIENIFRDSLTATGKTAVEQTANIGSAFDALEDTTNAKAAGIIEMVGRMGGAATQLGLSVQEVAGISATLADRSVEIEVAGTAMSKFFMDVLTDSGNWAAAMKLDAQAFSTALKNDPMQAIQMVVDGMAKLKDTQGADALAATLDDLGVKDTRLIDAMLKLADANLVLEKNVRVANAAFEDGTRLHQSANIAAESSVKQYELLKERMVEVGRGGGEVFEPLTTAALKFANEGLKKAIEGLQEIKVNGEAVGNEFGKAFGVENFGTIVADTFRAVKGSFEELATDADTFGEALKETFSLDNLLGDLRDVTWEEVLGGLADMSMMDMLLPPNASQAVTTWLTETITQPLADWFTAQQAEFMRFVDGIAAKIDALPFIGGKKTSVDLDAQAALEQLQLLRNALGDQYAQTDGLKAQYQDVFHGLAAALAANEQPSDALKAKFTGLIEEMQRIAAVGWEHSVFPDLRDQLSLTASTGDTLRSGFDGMTSSLSNIGSTAVSAFQQATQAIQQSSNAVQGWNALAGVTMTRRRAAATTPEDQAKMAEFDAIMDRKTQDDLRNQGFNTSVTQEDYLRRIGREDLLKFVWKHNGGLIRTYHAGGLAADEVPAILQTGEYVLSRADVQAVKSQQPDSVLRKVRGGRYHDGGAVAASSPQAAPSVVINNHYHFPNAQVVDHAAFEAFVRRISQEQRRQGALKIS